MKTVFSFILLISSFQAFSCKIDRKIVSLSGPITMLLEELNLLSDKNLLAVSNFHPVTGKMTKINGGLFIPASVLKKYKDAMIYFDKSNEFKKLLDHHKHKDYSVLDTRDQDPFEAYLGTVVSLRRVLSLCDVELDKIEKRVLKIKNKLLSLKINSLIFFLGEIKSRYPQLVMANDGPVLFLKNIDGFKTYESDLAYAPWSQKMMNNYDKYIKLGISESDKKFDLKSIKPKEYNLYGRGALIPGLTQINFLDEFFSEEYKNIWSSL